MNNFDLDLIQILYQLYRKHDIESNSLNIFSELIYNQNNSLLQEL